MNSELIIAIHALAYLEHCKCSATSERLAKSICTNPVRIRKVMAVLKKEGMITTKEGNNGGYQLSKKASEITLKDVSEALAIPLIKANWHSGTLNKTCMIASGMSEVVDDLTKAMQEQCLTYLANISIMDISEKLMRLAKDQQKEE